NSTLTAQASTIVALFGDLSLASMMGSRRDITFAISSDRFFEYDQLAIKGTQRYDIKVHDLGDATTAGPIVALKTPAS
ncbi:MAG TPA: phage major capsid protein, partial [Pseudomonadales bacterium]|nr:phage major capsid protein [Pseudomonadales bacterium]